MSRTGLDGGKTRQRQRGDNGSFWGLTDDEIREWEQLLYAKGDYETLEWCWLKRWEVRVEDVKPDDGTMVTYLNIA